MGNPALVGMAFVCTSACLTLTACTSQPQIVTAVLDARQRQDALPLPHRIDETLTIGAAYRIQTRIVSQLLNGAQPAGYKAGLTSEAVQARFHASAPVAGVLMPDGLRQSGDTIRLSELPGLHIETEVAFRIGTSIRGALTSVEDLRSHIDAIGPVIELPVMNYQTPGQLSTIDIIATNVGAAAFVVGDFAPLAERDPNEAEPQLICNGREVNSGKARDALGDQWQAALWLVNTMIRHGWTIEPGQLLLTGALGRMVPATAGECSANYGKWGTIALRLVP